MYSTKKIFLGIFLCQKPVKREATEGSSIEFIGYRIWSKIAGHFYSQGTNCRAFSIFWLVFQISTSKIGVVKLYETVCANGRQGKKTCQISKYPDRLYIISGMFRLNFTTIRQICVPYMIHSKSMYSSKTVMRITVTRFKCFMVVTATITILATRLRSKCDWEAVKSL